MTENFKNLKFKEKEIEDDSQQPTNEQEENMKSMASKPFLSEHVVEGLPKEKSDPRQLQDDQPFEEEADTVRSLGSDQSDDIETHSINGDGGGYVFLGSPQHEESHDIEKLKDDKDFNKGVPIETLEQIEQRGHVQELPHVPIEKEEEPKEAKPTFEEAAHSLGFPTNPPIEEIQKDAILEALVEIPPPTQGKEPKIEAPIEEPKTSIQEDEALIVVEQKEAPIETLDHIKKHVDVLEPLEVAFEKKDKPKEVEPSFQEAPHSLQLPISPPIEETQKDVTLEVQEQIVPPTKMEEPKIEALIEEPQVLDEVTLTEESQKVLEVEALKIEKPYIPSIEREDIPIVIQDKGAPIEAQKDVQIKAPVEGQALSKVEEPQIEAPITEPQILHKIETQEKEAPTLQEPYVPSIEQLQDEDFKPTSIEEHEWTPIVNEATSVPTQTFDELPQDNDVDTRVEVPTRKEVEPEEVEPSSEDLPRSLEHPISHPIEETQGDASIEVLQEGQHVSKVEEPQILPKFEAQDKEAPTLEEPHVPFNEQPQDEHVQPTSIKEQEETTIVKEDRTDPIQTLDELPQDDDVEVAFEVPTQKKVQPEDVEPSYENVP